MYNFGEILMDSSPGDARRIVFAGRRDVARDQRNRQKQTTAGRRVDVRIVVVRSATTERPRAQQKRCRSSIRTRCHAEFPQDKFTRLHREESRGEERRL